VDGSRLERILAEVESIGWHVYRIDSVSNAQWRIYLANRARDASTPNTEESTLNISW
jgi:hypothetical protein